MRHQVSTLTLIGCEKPILRAEITEGGRRGVVERPQLGGYEIDANVLSEVETDAEVRERMARWIVESDSLGIDIPNITIEHVRLFEHLAGLETAISEWGERREAMKTVDDERLRT